MNEKTFEMTIQVTTESAKKVIALLSNEYPYKVEAPAPAAMPAVQTAPAQTAVQQFGGSPYNNAPAPAPVPAAPQAPVYTGAPAYTAQPMPQQPPQAQPQTQAPPQVTGAPTSAPMYSIAQLQAACGPLADSGKLADLQKLIASFGVSSLAELPQARYGEFANGLRSLGGVL